MSIAMSTGVPNKLKRDADCPFFYMNNSWSKQQQIPWNNEDKRYMRPGK